MRQAPLIIGFCLLAGLSAQGLLAETLRPAPRPDWVGSDLGALIALSGSLRDQAEDLAHTDELDTPLAPAADAPILSHIVHDLTVLDEEDRLRELQTFAKSAVEAGRLEAFQTLMAAHVDPTWGELPSGLFALNTIAWLPDTANFLSTRIALGRHPALVEELSFEEQGYLWKDLRVRTERVGHPDYLTNLMAGMAETRHIDLLIQTLDRMFPSQGDQYDQLLALLELTNTRIDPDVRTTLTDQLDILWALGQSSRRDPMRLARLHMWAGNPARSNALLSSETDPIQRLRDRMTLFIHQAETDIIPPMDPAPGSGE